MPESATIDPETADWLTLDEDEEIVWSGKPHESSLIPALVVGLPLALIPHRVTIIAGSYLQRENTQYVVTTDGLYKKTGVLSRDVQRIDFRKSPKHLLQPGILRLPIRLRKRRYLDRRRLRYRDAVPVSPRTARDSGAHQ